MIEDYGVNKSAGEASNLRERLIECAAAMVEKGDTDISLRGVARAAGVSAMAPYRHFADKAAMIGAVAARGFAMLRQVLEAADRVHAKPDAALVAQGTAYVRFAGDRPALFRLMFADPALVTLTPNCETDAYAVLARRVAGLVSQDADTAMLACWSIVHGLAMLMLDGRIPAGDMQTDAVLKLFVHGLTIRCETHR